MLGLIDTTISMLSQGINLAIQQAANLLTLEPIIIQLTIAGTTAYLLTRRSALTITSRTIYGIGILSFLLLGTKQ